ncbi:MAG TPA: hypothetical protein VF137_10750 [Candidatus Dormibacteraeota bacterium]
MVPLLAAAKPSPPPGSHESQACSDFMKHLAANLGVSPSKLQGSLRKSADQTIDDAVKAGKLRAAQAAKIKARLANSNLCAFSGNLGRFGRHGAAGLSMGLLKAAAETLNLTPQQLMQDLRNGQTLSQLAHGMTEDQFRQALLAHLKTDLDAQVKAGKLTQTQETNLLQKLQNAPIPFWSQAPKMPSHAGWSGYPRSPAASPAASPATTS